MIEQFSSDNFPFFFIKMKRSLPPDITELQDQTLPEKPRFISKKERQQSQASPQPKFKDPSSIKQSTLKKVSTQKSASFFNASSEPDSRQTSKQKAAEYFSQTKERKKKRNRNKFEFSWGEEEDTSTNSLLQVDFNPNPSSKFDNLEPKRDKTVGEMSQRDWRIFREDHGITCKIYTSSGNAVPPPIRAWRELGVDAKLLAGIEIKYKKPTPIQMQVPPLALASRDVLALAETGSGKTLAFGIPILQQMHLEPRVTMQDNTGPHAVILAPTRELAIQISESIIPLAKILEINILEVVGGRDIQDQTSRIHNADIIVATPGRLVDLLKNRFVVLSRCHRVVLDEADRMVEMGFEPDLQYILNQCPVKRQTLMFSATMPAAVQRLSTSYLTEFVQVSVGEIGQVVSRIDQRAEVLSENIKPRRLASILGSNEFRPPIMIFTNEKAKCNIVQDTVIGLGFRAAVLHSGRSQQQRENALSQFKSGYIDVLIATDVAGRGIDVKDISLVINYDMANSIEGTFLLNVGYTHRIGRTARAGRLGCAITFLTDNEYVKQLESLGCLVSGL